MFMTKHFDVAILTKRCIRSLGLIQRSNFDMESVQSFFKRLDLEENKSPHLKSPPRKLRVSLTAQFYCEIRSDLLLFDEKRFQVHSNK